ncbi:hypothetical protein HK096_006201 [Nowakowskiella sp. JEL0078]|nr:hypothetical protein HK096_006201 [Nowakowskiella sp. JEL0078]
MSPHILLHVPPFKQNIPSQSGYCQKLETYFREAGFTSYSLTATSFSSAPKKKLPFITIEYPDGPKEKIADSHFIIKTLTSRGDLKDIDFSLTPQQRAESRAFCVWTEELLYPAVVNTRWARDDNFAQIQQSIMLPVPFFLRWFVFFILRRNVVNALWTAGVGRHTNEEVNSLMQEWVDAICGKLEAGGKWMLGTKNPSSVDVTVWAFIINALDVSEGNSEFKKMILERSILVSFVKRGSARWFPEYNVSVMLK